MPSVEELKTRIKALRKEKTQLSNELNSLKQQLAAKTLNSKQQKDVVSPVKKFVAVT
ncbi:MAG: hypothetical protein ACOWW1_08150 [archaeon]|nr:hypothetical protein [Candidatus Bathyarchaeum sp.]